MYFLKEKTLIFYKCNLSQYIFFYLSTRASKYYLSFNIYNILRKVLFFIFHIAIKFNYRFHQDCRVTRTRTKEIFMTCRVHKYTCFLRIRSSSWLKYPRNYWWKEHYFIMQGYVVLDKRRTPANYLLSLFIRRWEQEKINVLTVHWVYTSKNNFWLFIHKKMIGCSICFLCFDKPPRDC